MVAVETALPALGLEELSPSSSRMEPHGRASKCIVDSVLGQPVAFVNAPEGLISPPRRGFKCGFSFSSLCRAGSLAFLFRCFLWLCGDKCDFACCVFGVLETCTPNW
ncbi:hypothetical protein HPB48_021147 [Haemaphysalis longicornis]|uniref:Uncharacterized protein n=1 Tax=Haemaphysalis longicornis TaxID=44386 RepID=A0A9J6GBD1_HAELO|nr:hypothetical protein HPB48_021147 [Haemaphysalis longicornis]